MTNSEKEAAVAAKCYAFTFIRSPTFVVITAAGNRNKIIHKIKMIRGLI